MVAMGGNLGMDVGLGPVPVDNASRNDTILFSESAGRFIVTIKPDHRDAFEKLFEGLPCACIGRVTDVSGDFTIRDADDHSLVSIPVSELKKAWKGPFGDL